MHDTEPIMREINQHHKGVYPSWQINNKLNIGHGFLYIHKTEDMIYVHCKILNYAKATL